MSNVGLRTRAVLIAVALPVAAGAVESVPVPPQDKARVAEIAAKLRPESGFAETRAGAPFWTDAVTAKDRAYRIRRGEKMLKTPIVDWRTARFFPRKGKDIEDSTWTPMVRAAFDRIADLALAELVENRGRFLPELEKSLDAVCEIPTWTGFYHDKGGKGYRGEWKVLELGDGMQSELLAIVLDKLRAKLDPVCRARALKALRAMTLDTYLALAADPSVAKRNSCGWYCQAGNWNAACNRYFTSAAIHVLDDPTERATAIEFAERSSKAFLKSFTDDGLCLEGPGYWNYGFGNYLALALWTRAATGEFLGFVPEPFLRKCYLSSYEQSYSGGRAALFGDANFGDGGGNFAQHLGRYVWDDCDFVGTRGFFKEGANGFLVATVVPLLKKDPKGSRPYAFPIRSWYPDRIGLLVCRPVAGAERLDRLYAAVQGGFCTRPHGHHDVGSYSVAPGGIDVMGDLGNSKYTYGTFGPDRFKNPLRNSYGHPVPRVDGRVQSSGNQSFGRVVRTSFSDAEELVVYDLSTAYRDVKGLKLLERSFRYRRAANEIDVVDTVAFDGRKGTFETAFTTTGTVEELGDGVFRYVSRDKRASARCRIKVTGAAWRFTREELPGEVGSQWNTPGKSFKGYRQAVVLDEPVETAEIAVTWFADAASAR